MATPSATTTTTTTTLQMLGRVLTRAFHSSPATPTGHSRARLRGLLEDVPPYPFQVKHTFKQSWFGLYGGKHIQFGNNVGPKSNFKTRRRWLPNIRHKSLFSEALGKSITLDISTNVLSEYFGTKRITTAILTSSFSRDN
jgi:large subunit ribosomal protein L28